MSHETSSAGVLFDSDDEEKENNDNDVNDDDVVLSKSKDESMNIYINKEYAFEYEQRKLREELRQVRATKTVDDDGASDSSSSSSSEDEDAALLTPALDVHILKTINALRAKDARIYDPKTRFFGPSSAAVVAVGNPDETFDNNANDDNNSSSDKNDSNRNSKRKTHKTKRNSAKTYKDVLREEILAKMERDSGGDDDDHDDDDVDVDDDDSYENADPSRRKKPFDEQDRTSRLAYDAHQQALRQQFLDSVQDNTSSKTGKDHEDDFSDDDLLIVKSNMSLTGKEEIINPQLHQEFMQEIEKLRQQQHTGSGDRNHKLVDPRGEIQDPNAFLLDFFQNRAWVDTNSDRLQQESKTNHDEITNKDHHMNRPANGRPPSKRDKDDQWNMDVDPDVDDDDSDASLEQLERTDDFESRYNFRFEQATAETAITSGADFSLQSYARGHTMPTLRRNDDRRREKRLARQERKAFERQAKEEQLRRLKNAKRQEMEEKLKQIKAVLGQVDDNCEQTEPVIDEAAMLKLLEGDFDPDKFNALMQQSYSDKFYHTQDTEWKTDQGVRNSLLQQDEDGAILVGGDDAAGGLYDDNHQDDEDDSAEQDGVHDKNGNKRGNELDNEEEWIEEDDEGYGDHNNDSAVSQIERTVQNRMMEELYKLDYEDIVAGMPTRFKYRQVEPNNYGLSTEEILFARDSTLKQFVSLRKMAPYRDDGEYRVNTKKRRKFREIFQSDMQEEDTVSNQKQAQNEETNAQNQGLQEDEPDRKKKKKRRRLKRGKKLDIPNADDDDATGHDADDLTDYQVDIKQASGDAAASTMEVNPKSQGVDKNDMNVSLDKSQDGENSANKNASITIEKAKKRKKKQKKRKRKGAALEGISESRLASYGL